VRKVATAAVDAVGAADVPAAPTLEVVPPAPMMFSRDPGGEGMEASPDATHPEEHRYGDGRARITDFLVRDSGGRRTSRLESLERYEFVIRVEASSDVHDICVGVLIRTSRGTELYGSDSSHTQGIVPVLHAGEAVTYYVPFRNNLAPGAYFATVSLARTDSLKHDLRFDALEFFVEGAPEVYGASLTNLEMTFDIGEVETAAATVRLLGSS